MKFHHVDFKVGSSATGGGTEFTLKHWLVSSVNQLMCLQTIALGEPCLTDITNVWLFPSMYAQVAL